MTRFMAEYHIMLFDDILDKAKYALKVLSNAELYIQTALADCLSSSVIAMLTKLMFYTFSIKQ